jgi:hypothetical protein
MLKTIADKVFRIYAASGFAVLSLFKNGDAEGFVAQGQNKKLLFGVTNGLPNYDDGTLENAAQMLLNQNGTLDVKTGYSAAGLTGVTCDLTLADGRVIQIRGGIVTGLVQP